MVAIVDQARKKGPRSADQWARPRTTQHTPRITGATDAEILALLALRHNRAARERAALLGPDLFADPAARMVAGVIVACDDLDGEGKPILPGPDADPDTRRLAPEIIALCDYLERSGLSWDDATATARIEDLAERRHRPLVSRQLAWAASMAAAGAVPLHRLRQAVNAAIDIAEGRAPADGGVVDDLDPEKWGMVRKGWRV